MMTLPKTVSPLGVVALMLLVLVAPSVTIADSHPKAFDRVIRPLLTEHCVACHGADEQESNVRFDQMSDFAIGDRHLWTMVHEKVSAGKMPPKDEAQLSGSERKALLSWIETEQRALGAGTTRRLNRRELSGALQDLTGLPVEFADGLPGDGKLDGFDTGASALQDAASSIDQIMQVTRRTVDGLRFLEPSPAVEFYADLRETSDARKALDSWKANGATPKTRGFAVKGVGLLLETKWLKDRGGLEITIPVPEDRRGLLRLTVEVSQQKYFDGVPNPHLWVNIGGKAFGYREITAPSNNPHKLEYVVQLEDVGVDSKGAKIVLAAKVEVPYGVEGFANDTKAKEKAGQSVFRPKYDRKQRSPEKLPVPFVVLQSIKVESDYMAKWPPASWKRTPHRPREDATDADETTFDEIRDDLPSARRLIAAWIDRAWRRPAAESEQQRFVELYERLRDRGFSFDAAVGAAFHSVLLSPEFRYLASPADKDKAIGQYAVASRLSFMLWGAPPDAELRRLAANGKLHDPRVLASQVDRMLADARSERFFRPFIMQWLELHQPITVTQDHLDKQDFQFGRHLKESMKEETLAYIARLFSEDRPATELIDSDWTMMNQSLAVHYGYEGVDGAGLRKVSLRKDDPRGGGILSHAGIQSMLCWMGDNWVIYRGAWALRHILDDPPPPPPLDVPELDPSAGNNRGKSFKELLQQHQENPKCAVCHESMDPLGFAFQNFDVSGRWRDREFDVYKWGGLDGKKVWTGAGKSRPVDAVGRLPRGEEFSSFAEFKSEFLNNYVPDLTRGLLKNLMIYATGRRPDVDDMAEIRSIMKAHQSRRYPMKALLKSVVQSQAFLDH